MQYSSNQFSKAVTAEEDTQKQNQLMEQVNVDVVDMINQILNFTYFPDIKPATFVPCKSTQDVAYLTAQAAGRLRLILDKVKRGTR